jgi:hypothetical protein
MILLGCLLAFGAAVAPRVILVLAWLFAERWALVWRGDWILPLLGIIFLPYTTIMFMLAVDITPSGPVLTGFGWVWVALGFFLDIWKWTELIAKRQVGLEYGQSIYKSNR